MTRSKIIPKTEAESLEIWDFPYVGSGPAPETKSAPKVSMPTAEEVEQIQKQAHDEAFKQGYDEGLQKGLEEGKTNGHAQGLEQGRNEGLLQGQATIQERAQLWESLLETLSKPLAELDVDIEQSLVTLSMTVARHVVRRELKTDSGQIIGAVRKAVSVLPISVRDVRVYMHPDDAAIVRESLSISEVEDEEKRWTIVEDPALTRGGCNIESKQSRVDATVEARISAAITQVFGGDRESDA